MWTDRRLLQLFGVEHPIIQAPMAGAHDADLAIAVAKSGGLGSLPCALLTAEKIREEIQRFRAQVKGPLNLNFFCHEQPALDPTKEKAWRTLLQEYYREFAIDPNASSPTLARQPFHEEVCRIIEDMRPEVVSFHFGLPAQSWMKRVKASGARIIASATTVAEACWLEEHGCDAVIAQGSEAGGHRGNFLSENEEAQVGTMALVPAIVDAVKVPVIAAGGIGDARGIQAALSLGAAGVQIGTAFLLAAESKVSALHRNALRSAKGHETALTNLFTGRPARGIINRLMREQGPISAKAPAFPDAAGALAPLRAAAEARGLADFSPLWSGQAVHLAREESAATIMSRLCGLGEGSSTS